MTSSFVLSILIASTLLLDCSYGYKFLGHVPKSQRASADAIRLAASTRGDTDSVPPVGQPLILTDYWQDKEKGRSLSEVTLDGYDHASYSGYFTVQKEFNSNMFFWFFPAQSGTTSAPLILWLQGGPGAPSMYGLFEENGPFEVTENLELVKREFSWNQQYNLLYIDNPVGTGYSFTDSQKGFVTNEDEVAENLYKTLQQFFYFFPEYVTNDFYLTGESYAGKYIPALGVKIHDENARLKSAEELDAFVINLVGISLGDPLNDPIHTLDRYSEFYYNLGLVSDEEAAYIKNQTDYACNDLMANGDYAQANTVINNLLGYLQSVTQLNLLNYMENINQTIPEYYIDYIEQLNVRAKIHVGYIPYEANNAEVENALVNDVMASQAADFSFLINQGYKTLLYNGIQDLEVGASMTESSLLYLDFDLKEKYFAAPRNVWILNNDVAGYVQRTETFLRVVVRGAGHIVPHDQPERAFEMITNFIEELAFS